MRIIAPGKVIAVLIVQAAIMKCVSTGLILDCTQNSSEVLPQGVALPHSKGIHSTSPSCGSSFKANHLQFLLRLCSGLDSLLDF